VNTKLTLACSLSVKENVVPTGGFFLREKVASLLASRQVDAVWAAFARIGGVAVASGVVGAVPHQHYRSAAQK
jgi:hypothetical protein